MLSQIDALHRPGGLMSELPPERGERDLRGLLFSIAYEMLGEVGDAEDVVQEAYLRLHRVERDGGVVESPRRFLTTVTARLAIDQLRSARVRRERYFGPWLPEPLLTDTEPDPADLVQTADSLSLSFLVLLERLSPVERAVFLLREVFDYEYAEIAEIVERTEVHCRQICARARKRIESGKPRFSADRAQQREIAARFVAAFEQGDIERLVELLSPDVVFTGDGGGKGSGLPRPVFGRARVGRLLLAFIGQARAAGAWLQAVDINGQPGTLNFDAGGKLINVFVLEVTDGSIQGMCSIINPDKLDHLGYPLSELGRKRDSSH